MSSDCRLFWKSPSQEKLSYWNFLLLFFCLVPPLPIHFVYSVLSPPWNHWRREKLGISREGWKACDTFEEKHILYCWTVAHTFDTHLKNVWELVLHYPWIWEGLPKREWEGYSIQLLNLVFEILTLSPPGTSFCLCTEPLCFTGRESSNPRDSIYRVSGGCGAVRWGCACPPASQSRRKLEHNCPGSEEGKTLCLCKGVCRPPATKGRGYLQTFFELSRLGSILNLHLPVKQTSSSSCVSKLVKQSSSIFGIFQY